MSGSRALLAFCVLGCCVQLASSCEASDMITEAECAIMRRAVQGDLELCYSAKEHGWCKRCVHRNCDDKGPSLTIAQVAGRGQATQRQGVEGRVFGGFVTKSLRYDAFPQGGYTHDAEAWLYRYVDGKLERAFAKDGSKISTATANQDMCLSFGSHDLDISGPDCKTGYTVPSSFEFPSNSWLAGCQDCFELRNLEVYTVRNWNASRQCTWGRRPRCHSARHPAAHASTCTASVDQADCEMTQAVARCTPKNAFITEVYQEPGKTSYVKVRNNGNEACTMEGWRIDTKEPSKEPSGFRFNDKAVIPAMATWKANIADTALPFTEIFLDKAQSSFRIGQPGIVLGKLESAKLYLSTPDTVFLDPEAGRVHAEEEELESLKHPVNADQGALENQWPHKPVFDMIQLGTKGRQCFTIKGVDAPCDDETAKAKGPVVLPMSLGSTAAPDIRGGVNLGASAAAEAAGIIPAGNTEKKATGLAAKLGAKAKAVKAKFLKKGGGHLASDGTANQEAAPVTNGGAAAGTDASQSEKKSDAAGTDASTAAASSKPEAAAAPPPPPGGVPTPAQLTATQQTKKATKPVKGKGKKAQRDRRRLLQFGETAEERADPSFHLKEKCVWQVPTGQCHGVTGCHGLDHKGCLLAKVKDAKKKACHWGPVDPTCFGGSDCEMRTNEGSCKAAQQDCSMHRSQTKCEGAPPHLSMSSKAPLKGRMVRCKWSGYFADGAGEHLQCFEDDEKAVPVEATIRQPVHAASSSTTPGAGQ